MDVSVERAAGEPDSAGGVGDAAPGPFAARHIGPTDADVQQMLDGLGYDALESLVDVAVPAGIRLSEPLTLDRPLSQAEALGRLAGYGEHNRVMRSMIGRGYHGTHTPPVIRRNVLEDPRWYTPYTPYQAEVSQGRLEALLNFQTMIAELTGLPLANASLLDEATAAAEAMAMCHAIAKPARDMFIASDRCHPQTLAVLATRAEAVGLELRVVSELDEDGGVSGALRELVPGACGVLVQYPDTRGVVDDFDALAEAVHDAGALLVAAADPLALALLRPPGSWGGGGSKGADIAIGSTQRFGVPMGFGGPHAAYLATREQHARKLPGRLVGVSQDRRGTTAYRLALQTREQHIRRDKATSNICTAQVLLAVVAGFYGVHHGPDGLQQIARHCHRQARRLADGLTELGYAVGDGAYFDTITVGFRSADALIDAAADAGINLRRLDGTTVGITCDETTTDGDVDTLLRALAFGRGGGVAAGQADGLTSAASNDDDVAAALQPHQRDDEFMAQPVFHEHRSETALMRYIDRLAGLDLSLTDGMIPLGSCTMKLNAAAQMLPILDPAWADMHPFCPSEQAGGYDRLLTDLRRWIGAITGLPAVSLQPNAGSQGEFAGLLAIRGYHRDHASDSGSSSGGTSGGRDVCLIPTSAHGTNPASAVMAGMRVVPVACRDNGDIDLDDLTAKADQHADRLAALMITYPSTHGVFEAGATEACRIVHERGALVYLDGANLNAQVGLTSPAAVGADVCHLNLHKTFCIPHGGGGPGMGPIAATEALRPFLPGRGARVAGRGGAGLSQPATRDPQPTISAAPFGSPMILPIPWVYIATMAGPGLTRATQIAILSANHMARRLAEHYPILYTGRDGTVAHEFIIDCRPFEKSANIRVEDIAKRLIDFGFHAPTMSWPVPGTLMIEPTESEPLAELDRFCDALIAIRHEIAAIEAGELDRENNPLQMAPHTAAEATADDWPHPYPRSQAVYPVDGMTHPGRKYWPPVSRVDNAHGDRNLVCTCPSVEDFAS